MRLLILILIGLFASCGSSPDAGDDTEMKNDSVPVMAAAGSGDNLLSDAEKAEGWTLLFDGNTTAGWHSYQNILSRWKVEDGALDADSTRGPGLMGKSGVMGGSMVTDKEYENFHLKVDWKISEGGNSGIMILVNEDPSISEDYQSAPEFQILDNAGYRGFGYPTKDWMQVGALYGVLPSADTSGNRPANEWNTTDIIKNGNSLEFKLNGVTTIKTTLWDDNWSNLKAASRYNNPYFAALRKGKISLQDHGYKVWFRNIKLKEL